VPTLLSLRLNRQPARQGDQTPQGHMGIAASDWWNKLFHLKLVTRNRLRSLKHSLNQALLLQPYS
jgi:hypothetical protein